MFSGLVYAQMHFRCFWGYDYFQLCQTVVLNNYEQVGWVLNLAEKHCHANNWPLG